MSKISVIRQHIIENRNTLLCVGPMSKNCVDVVIDVSEAYGVPIKLIASRRQIDCEELGGGYVNNWCTSAFGSYVTQRDKKQLVCLARDHGGPWQNTREVESNLDLASAMASAKLSMKSDIDAGFDVIHIDPSIDIHKSLDVDDILERIYELYDYCWGYAKSQSKEISFEIGTEEQSGGANTPSELKYVLNQMTAFCESVGAPMPLFVVVQCGSRVMEMENVGAMDSLFRVKGQLPPELQIPRMVNLTQEYGVFIKTHNTDYITDETLKWHPRLGIHASNVAPEFGVVETRSFLKLLEISGLTKLRDRFIEVSFNSGKWQKWMFTNTQASDFDKAVIAGHYNFSTLEGLEIFERARIDLLRLGISLDQVLKRDIKAAIVRYLKLFGTN